MKFLAIIAAISLIVLVITSCGSTAATTTAAATTPTGMPQYRPIDVVSVLGPMPPINPGGPTVQITLKNNAAEPLVALTVTLELNKVYDFTFDVNQDHPLTAGATAEVSQTLIGGAVSDTETYSLVISGTAQSGSVFNYTVQVQIGTPPPAN